MKNLNSLISILKELSQNPKAERAQALRGFLRFYSDSEIQKVKAALRADVKLSGALKKVKEIAQNQGGFTLNKNLSEYQGGGYAVGLRGLKFKSIEDFKAADLMSILKEAGGSIKIGGWIDSESGKFYLDVVKIYKSKAAALKKAEALNEIAIFDFENLKEIRIQAA